MEDNKEILSAAGGMATGSILGGILGGKRGKKRLESKIAKTKNRRDISAAKSNLKAVEGFKSSAQGVEEAKKLSREIDRLSGIDKRGEEKLKSLTKKAKKLGRRKGAILGAGAGLLAGLGGYEYLKNRRIDNGYNQIN